MPRADDPELILEAAAAIAVFYRDAAVRARIAEYSEGSRRFAGYGGLRRRQASDMAPVSVGADPSGLFGEGADVCRSLEDDRGALIQLDVDYVSPDDPAEPYRDPARCFERLEPVYRAVRAALARVEVPTLDLMTGRGYHFTARAVRGGGLHRSLCAIGRDGHAGAGRLLEALAHELVRTCGAELPLTIADVPPPGRGPFVCLDLSAYADPAASRVVRAAFSSHQKASMLGLPRRDPFVVALPRGGRSLPEMLRLRCDPGAAQRVAAETQARIPDVSEAPRWVKGYSEGVLSWLHRRLDEAAAPEARAAAERYAAIPPAHLPVCVTRALDHPNPGLLVPTALRAVTLVLWAQRWHPREVAALIRSRYEGDHGWGDLWTRYDASSRAEFYVRTFAGAAVAGLDDASDFTCTTQQQRGGCPGGHCGHELAHLFPGHVSVAGLEGAGW